MDTPPRVSLGFHVHRPSRRHRRRGVGVGTRRPAGAPAHRVIQVQVRVKLGDQVVTLVQLGNFPWEPEDFTEDRRKGELGEHWPVGGSDPPREWPPQTAWGLAGGGWGL